MLKKPFLASRLSHFISKLPGFSKPDRNSIRFLNLSQFLGVLNENIYKLVLVFFLIDLQGISSANTILAATGIIFVIPFILFSSLAGGLADRFSKTSLIMIIKAIEIVVMALILFAFAFHSKGAGYFLLFLLTTQEALFGPSKYGIIPDLVPRNQVTKANGLITSFTYLAIILGTFLASFLSQITNRHYVVIGVVILFFSIIGFVSTFGIQYVPPKGVQKKINFFFLQDIYRTLKLCREKKHLLIVIVCSSFFMFIGSFTQLNIIPFAIQALKLNEISGGYLFLSTALGIALGAYLAGRVSKKTIELGLSCLAGFMIALSFFLIGAFSSHPYLVVICLFLLGISGGCFIVPCDSFIQVTSPEGHRGHVIGATNFLSFCGVLVAAIALYFFNEIIGLSSAQSFLLMGILTLLFSIYLFFRLSEYALSYFSKRILLPFFKLELVNIDLVYKASHPLLILQKGSWLKVCLLSSLFPQIFLLVPQNKGSSILKFFYSIRPISSDQMREMMKERRWELPEGSLPCLYLKKEFKLETSPQPFFLSQLFQMDVQEAIFVNFEELKWGSAIIKFSKKSF